MTQLHQVFINLLVNARDAMPNGGLLRLLAFNFLVDESYAKMNLEAHVGPYVAVTVEDTGTGISPEIKERIFDPFFTTKEVGKGTGLGLSTVMGIVKNHGGFIQVSSEMGKGSQFTVFLPSVQESISQSSEEEESPRGKGELILVVDDEVILREITKLSLENFNYRVLMAADGIEAITVYAEHQKDISLVLMDLVMPNLGGLTAIRTLLKINPQVKIIAMSALPDQHLALAAGSKKFLLKPYTLSQLLNSLAEIITASAST